MVVQITIELPGPNDRVEQYDVETDWDMSLSDQELESKIEEKVRSYACYPYGVTFSTFDSADDVPEINNIPNVDYNIYMG